MTKPKRCEIKYELRCIAGNTMFQFDRRFRVIEGQKTNLEAMSKEEFQAYLESITLEPLPEFEDYIQRKIEVWTSFLAEEDLPRPYVPVRVAIADDGVPEWIEITDDKEIVEAFVGNDTTGSVLLGSDYINLVVKPFSFA